MSRAFCPECPHCAAVEAAKKGDDPAKVLHAATRRCWQQPYYGRKLTGVVDWYDGWGVGVHARSQDEAVVPRQIIDQQSWFEGFAEGWADGEQARQWRERVEAMPA